MVLFNISRLTRTCEASIYLSIICSVDQLHELVLWACSYDHFWKGCHAKINILLQCTFDLSKMLNQAFKESLLI
jgi:hypothetical protein